MSATAWYLMTGLVLCAMAIAATLVQRLPLTTAAVYLPLGWALGPNGFHVLDVRLPGAAPFVEEIATVVILISVFAAGLKIRLSPASRLWLLSFRLAFFSMIVTIALVAAVAVEWFGLSWGAGLLLGGMLAPTDPVLASDVEIEDPFHLRALPFGLTSEAGSTTALRFPS